MERKKGIWNSDENPQNQVAQFPKCSIFEQFRNNAQQYINLPAIEFQNKQFTFKQSIETIEKLAKALLVTGVKKGDIVSIISPNTPQGVFMFYAVNRIGAIANMIHPLLSPNEIQNFVESTESTAVFTMDVVYNRIAEISWTKNSPKIIIGKVIDVLPFYLKPLFALKTKGSLILNPSHDCIFWNDLMTKAESSDIKLPKTSGSPDDLAVILYSGGTTGIQKGVMLTNYNFTCYAIQAYEASGMDPVGKRCLTVLPLFHGFGIALCVHTMLSYGACIYLVPTYDFNKCNTLIFKKKLNFLCGVPAFFETLSRYPDFEGKDLSFIECLISGGDVLPEKLQLRINKQLKAGGSKARIREAYGQTESVTGCCINPDFANVIGSVGVPCPDIESKVVELGTINEVPNGTDGELCLSGPNIMLGYFKNEEATRKVLKLHEDGKIWLHTGDIFTKREDGYLFFKQRLSRVIVHSGFNIYLSQIEDCLSDCEIVEQCCAVGIDDKVVGSRVGLYVILKNKTDKNSAQRIILDHCRQNIAEYAFPSQIVFVDEFPKTKMGKIDFKNLEDRINNR
ncbi:MAG: acyl--CoA ligase [Clostridia bacterium]|nr:acyl--CoA ligase [Clostridia bacterium]